MGLRLEGRLLAIKEYDVTLTPELFQGFSILVVENGLTRTFINSRRVPNNNIGESELLFDEFEIYQKAVGAGNNPNFPPIIRTTPFNEFGRRKVLVSENGGRQYIQGITRITPEYAVVSGIRTPGGKSLYFDMRIALTSIPPKVIQRLLRLQIADPDDLLERERLVAFYIKAGMLNQAAAELAELKSDFPGQDFERVSIELESAIHRRSLDEIRFRFDARQADFAESLWNSYNKTDLPATIAAEFLEVRDQIVQQKTEQEQALGRVQNHGDGCCRSR